MDECIGIISACTTYAYYKIRYVYGMCPSRSSVVDQAVVMADRLVTLFLSLLFCVNLELLVSISRPSQVSNLHSATVQCQQGKF